MAVEKNGFNLDGSLVPVDAIEHGGPARDGIPSIDKPQFIKARQADFLNDDDRILAIDYQGVQRAYPIRILNWHEIVNDRIKGQSVVVSYCPLCGTGLVYSGRIQGKDYQFGVSGLLYNSDVLMYDRQSESLWSQILAKAVTGSLKGTKLTTLPVEHTTWGKWRKAHPNTQVLSTETGYQRDYTESPYAGYEQSESVYFRFSAESRRYHPKERVLGVEVNGQFKAYPFVELARTGQQQLQDNFAGQTLQLSFDATTRTGKVQDAQGQPVHTINSFWFAWYAFHPDTAIFEVKP